MDNMEWTEEKLQDLFHKKYPQRHLKLESKGNRRTTLQEGTMTILTGYPAIGKTRLSFQIIYDMILQNKNVLCFSLQMSSENLVAGLIKQCSDENIINVKVEKHQGWDKVLFDNGNSLYIDDTPGIKINDIIHRSIKLCEKDSNIQLIVVDFLQLVWDHQFLEGIKHKNDELLISKCLRNLTIDLKTTTLVISRLMFHERTYLRGSNLIFASLNKLVRDRTACDDVLYLFESEEIENKEDL